MTGKQVLYPVIPFYNIYFTEAHRRPDEATNKKIEVLLNI
jgi:hypothetical protein